MKKKFPISEVLDSVGNIAPERFMEAVKKSGERINKYNALAVLIAMNKKNRKGNFRKIYEIMRNQITPFNDFSWEAVIAEMSKLSGWSVDTIKSDLHRKGLKKEKKMI